MRSCIEIVSVHPGWRPLDSADASPPVMLVLRRRYFATPKLAESFRRRWNAKAIRESGGMPDRWAMAPRGERVVFERAPRASNQAKRRKVLRALADPLWAGRSDAWVARHCNVSRPFVAKMRELAESQV